MKPELPQILALALSVSLALVTPVWAQASSEPAPAPVAAASVEPNAAPLTTERDRVSYAVGVTTGRALRSADGAEVNFDVLVRGLKDGLEGAHLQIPERQMMAMLQKFQQDLRQKMAASRGRAVVENRQKAEKFLAENKSKEGIVTLPSGVQYRILKAGTGVLPKEVEVVTVNYRGTLLNGHEFDATEPGHPAHLTVGTLIAGWKEALKLMPVGSHWQLFIPPALGYGERGIGADIGPNEALVFDVELLGTQLPNE